MWNPAVENQATGVDGLSAAARQNVFVLHVDDVARWSKRFWNVQKRKPSWVEVAQRDRKEERSITEDPLDVLFARFSTHRPCDASPSLRLESELEDKTNACLCTPPNPAVRRAVLEIGSRRHLRFTWRKRIPPQPLRDSMESGHGRRLPCKPNTAWVLSHKSCRRDRWGSRVPLKPNRPRTLQC